jgi:chromosome segregation ATPase
MRPKAEAASRFEEELKETSAELAQTHKQILRLENILEKYKLKAEESALLIRQNETLEDENAQMKESLRSRELVRSGSRGGLDASARMDADRMWAEEKNDLELEITRLKERLKVVEDQSSRDVSVIASLEGRLRESTPVATAVEEDLEGDDLNSEMSTTRQDLRLQVTRLERELAATHAELEFAQLAAKGYYLCGLYCADTTVTLKRSFERDLSSMRPSCLLRIARLQIVRSSSECG